MGFPQTKDRIPSHGFAFVPMAAVLMVAVFPSLWAVILDLALLPGLQPAISFPPCGILPFLDVEALKETGFRLARFTKEDCCFMGSEGILAKVKCLNGYISRYSHSVLEMRGKKIFGSASDA